MNHGNDPLAPVFPVVKVERGQKQMVIPHETLVVRVLFRGGSEIDLERVGNVVRVPVVS